MQSVEDLLKKLQARFINGEISEHIYRELKADIEKQIQGSDKSEVGDIVATRSNVTIDQSTKVYHGDDPTARKQATKEGEHCPICGGLVKDDYFTCDKCKRGFIHKDHQDPDSYYCSDCVALEKACSLLSDKKYQEAKEEFRQILRKDPGHAAAEEGLKECEKEINKSENKYYTDLKSNDPLYSDINGHQVGLAGNGYFDLYRFEPYVGVKIDSTNIGNNRIIDFKFIPSNTTIFALLNFPNRIVKLFLSSGDSYTLYETEYGDKISCFGLFFGNDEVLVIGQEHHLVVYRPETKKIESIIENSHNRPIKIIKNFSNNTDNLHYLASISEDGVIKIWESGGSLGSLTLKLSTDFTKHTNQIKDIVWNKNSRCVASVCEDNIVRLWDISSGSEIGTLKDDTEKVNALSFHDKNKNWIFTGGNKGTIKLWDFKNKKIIYTFTKNDTPITKIYIHEGSEITDLFALSQSGMYFYRLYDTFYENLF